MRGHRDEFTASVDLSAAKAFASPGHLVGDMRVVTLPATIVAARLGMPSEWLKFEDRGLDRTVQPYVDRIISLAAREDKHVSERTHRCVEVAVALREDGTIQGFQVAFQPVSVDATQGEGNRMDQERLQGFISDAIQFAEELSKAGGVPLPAVVEGSSGMRVLPVREEDQDVIDELQKLLGLMVESYREESDQDFRGHYAVAETIKALGQTERFTVAYPLTAEGRKKSTGYPNLEIRTPAGAVYYLSVATTGDQQAASGLRSFYFEPKRKGCKITGDAVHLQITFTTQVEGDREAPTEVLITDLSSLKLRFKPEFQASNVDLLSKCKHVGGYRA